MQLARADLFPQRLLEFLEQKVAVIGGEVEEPFPLGIDDRGDPAFAVTQATRAVDPVFTGLAKGLFATRFQFVPQFFRTFRAAFALFIGFIRTNKQMRFEIHAPILYLRGA